MYVILTNDFDKKFVLAFYNYFRKIKLYSLTDISSSGKINRKNDHAVKIMIKTQILLWLTIEGYWLWLGFRVRFILLYSESMLQTLLGSKNMSQMNNLELICEKKIMINLNACSILKDDVF